MRVSAKAAAAVAALATFAVAGTAHAKCTRLAFSVNDYGKDGPIRDAKALLDKYIAQWTAERGIKKYTTGKKDVSCELYLDLIVFDEHTCKAEATVCWSETGGTGAPISPKPVKAAAPAAPKEAAAGAQAVKPAPKPTAAAKEKAQ